MYCPSCARAVPDESEFCLKCGARLPLVNSKCSDDQSQSGPIQESASAPTARIKVSVPQRGFVVDRADLEQRYASMANEELAARLCRARRTIRQSAASR
jgi:hypothetical protein